MNESILERFKKQVEEDRLNENNELPKDTSLTNPMDKKEYEKRLEALRNSEIDIENQYKQAMNRLIHLKENELSNSDNIKEIEITKITVKHAYCTDCGTELVSVGPTMFNPFTMEKQNIHTYDKCGKKYNLEYAYPRFVFYDENNNEVFGHCE